jgi:hypothetical protein
MRVQVGPVPSGSVLIWVAYARTVLAQSLAHPGAHPPMPSEAIDAFESFLDEWDDVAGQGTEFVWIADVDPERVEYLAHVWFQVAARLASEAEVRGFPLSPPEGEEFYQALVSAILDALAYEGRSLFEFSEQLREQWPGLKGD